jgi:hypothetical protein
MKNKLASVLVLASILFCSCATFEKNSQTTAGVIDIAVTVAMNVWSVYVAEGRVSQSDIDKVNKAFAAYTQAKKVFADAMAAYKSNPNASTVQLAITALNYAASDLGDLIRILLPPQNREQLLPIKRP